MAASCTIHFIGHVEKPKKKNMEDRKRKLGLLHGLLAWQGMLAVESQSLSPLLQMLVKACWKSKVCETHKVTYSDGREFLIHEASQDQAKMYTLSLGLISRVTILLPLNLCTVRSTRTEA